jgi:uncharacterized protein YpmB
MKKALSALIIAVCLIITVVISTFVVRTASNPETSDLNEAGGLFKTITDLQSGEYAIVSSNKRVVSLKDKRGKTIWYVDMVKISGDSPIYSMVLADDKLKIQVGRSYFGLNKKTGKVIFSYSL